MSLYDMIQLFLYSGVAVIQNGLQNLVVRIILAIEVTAILLGIMIGLLVYINGKSYIWLLIPGLVGCVIFVFINTLGKTMLSNADIWPPLLAENLVVFSVISCMVFYLKNDANRKVSERSK